MSSTLQIKRGTRQRLDELAIKGQLLPGEPLLITDENRLAVAVSTTQYEAAATEGETASGAATWGAITGTLSAQTDLNSALAGKEPSITAGTTSQFWRGDKSWTDFATTVRASTLTGLSTVTNAVITAADTVLSALGKLQKQISDHFGAGGTAHANATTSVAGFMSGTDKTKLDGIAAGAQVNVGTNIAEGTRTTTTVPITSSTGTGATLSAASTTLAGVMTSADKTKLDGIATGATANVGTVTSVGGTGTVSGISLSGTVTNSGNLTLGGTLAVTPSNFASQTANTILAAPNGVAGVPTFRAIVAADVPTLNQNTTGSAATLTTARTINGVSFNGSANILVPSSYDATYRRVTNPGGGQYITSAATVTGALAIALPTGVYGQSKMVTFRVTVYEYLTGESIQIQISGYQYSAGNWLNMSGYILAQSNVNRNYSIRFAKDTTNLRYVVYVGELATVWDYPQVFITDVQNGYGSDQAGWESGWSIYFEPTAFATVAATINNPQIGYSATTNTANALVLRDASGNFSAGTITATLSGNASTVTNGVYTTGSYADPAWITSINYSKLTGTVPTWNQNTTGNAATATTLQTARTINGVSFDGSANITVADSTKQPLDADLTAIAVLAGTSGLLRKTAADTWSLDTNAYVTSSGVTSVTGTAPIVSSGGTTPAISITAATTSAAGSMSAADKTKLDGIATGATANTGTVTSVGGTGTVSGLTLSGTVTTSGNLTLGGTLAVTPSNFASQTANTFLAAPNGAAGVPTFRGIVAADVPVLNQNTTGTATNVTGTVAIANGGTGATTAAAARTNLGATTVGSSFFTVTNPSAIRFARVNADNTVSLLSDADFRTAIGVGAGGGGSTAPTDTEIIATAGQTVFSVTYAPTDVSVYLNGVRLSNADYTATNGTSITLTVGAKVGSVLKVRSYAGVSSANTKENIVYVTGNLLATQYRVYVFRANATLTLPATPVEGDWVRIVNRSGLTSCIIARNGLKIMGLLEDLTLDTVTANLTLVYTDTTDGWVFV